MPSYSIDLDLQSILSNLMADNRLLPVFLERAVMQQDLNLRKLNVIIKFVAQNHGNVDSK